MWLVALVALSACGTYDAATSAAKSIGGWAAGTLAEYTICPANIIDCGHVFECTGTRADTPSGFVELCLNDDDEPEQLDEIEAMYGMCSPTPRHQGLCRWCPPDGGRGCNAFNGCWGCP